MDKDHTTKLFNEIKEEKIMDIVDLLETQAKEIADQDIPGWGNTMLWAAEKIKKLRQEATNKTTEANPT